MLSRYGLVKLHPHPKSTSFKSSQVPSIQEEDSTEENAEKNIKDNNLKDSACFVEDSHSDTGEEKDQLENSVAEIVVPSKKSRRRVVKRKGEHLSSAVKTEKNNDKESLENLLRDGEAVVSLGADLIEITQKSRGEQKKKKMEENANQFDDLIRMNFASAFISNEVAREPTLRQYMVPDENRHWAIHAKDRGIFKQRGITINGP